jgi:hypothetical protein
VTPRKTADRYLRTGGPVPQIYFGTLAGVEQAKVDAQAISKFLPELVFTVIAVHGRERKPITAYQAGREAAA